jgi:hypothetical protein
VSFVATYGFICCSNTVKSAISHKPGVPPSIPPLASVLGAVKVFHVPSSTTLFPLEIEANACNANIL